MSEGTPRRFPIRYSIQRWNDNLWFYGSLFVIVLVFIIAKLLLRQPILNVLPLLVLDGLLLLVFWVMRIVSYLEITEEAVRVRYITRRMDLPFSAVARVRRQPLEVAFQPAERRRFVNRFVRRLAREPAAYIRLDRRHDDVLEQAERRLGPRLVAGADVVVPIVDVDEFVASVKSRLRSRPT